MSTDNGEPTGRERRQSERTLVAWEQKLATLGRSPTLPELFAAVDTDEWSYGFVVAVDPMVEVSSLLVYGADFARLLDMPKKNLPFVRMSRQLPARYTDLFMRGCTQACHQEAPERVEGEVEREDGRRELFRAIFIPVEPEENSPMRYAFGTFSSRIADPS
ncbi:MAG: hypothetical protein JO001_04365 [Alphaproteobacteria bacterium]|nr:hypothetical protein [Alphaproteobacteria bacterium]